GDEFIVSGFEAEWPDAAATDAGVAASPPPPPTRTNAPPEAMPEPSEAAAAEDVFFIDDAVEPPPSPASAAAADTFFIEDLSLPPVAGPAPVDAVTPAFVPVVAAGAPAPPHGADAADMENLSFAAAFLEEAKAEPARPTAGAPPRPSPAAAPPAPKAKAAPTAPPLPSTPKAAPSVSQSVPRTSVPPHSPSSTAAHRPLPRPPDVSQSVARGARPPTSRAERTQSARPRPSPAPIGRYAAIGGGALAVLGGLAFLVFSLTRAVSLDGIEPRRARVGETVALTGSGFDASPEGNVVRFGEKEAKVVAATPVRLDVVVPDVAIAAGAEASMPVRVRVGRAESKAVEVSVFAGPVLHGISPDVAMPGEEVVLAGSGWGLGPSVRFGGLAAEVLEVRETSIRVRVPAIEGGVGTAAPVVVISGLAVSNAGPFYVGHIPLVLKAEPTTVSPGDVVTLSGRGFRRERTQNSAQVGGARALVVSALDSEIKVVVPRAPAGSRTLEVRVPSSVTPAQVPLVVTGLGEGGGFRFVAEPFDDAPGRDHAVLATGLGPAFVLASSGGRSSAERAFEAARRMNDAGASLKTTPGLNFELRDADSRPTLGLAGRPEALLEVTAEDASAYAEDWTGLKGRGGPVSPDRLGRWWEVVAKDLVLLLVRGERPHFAADVAPEGR
ncbi:MAG TPA: IPT/TIG domain-containing protein, partial [Vicinamibacteria bacterium]|nr:IPT/TIG domain-containing protein [Vicinamibacteria bacterium]